VGKTHAIREFGEQYYTNTAYFNLEINETVSSYFSENIEPERILRFLETESHERIVPGDTLIIFDEIQSCERALTSLKYFNEKTPEHHIICAGSLLGVAVNRERYSFPVGNVDSMTLFPMDFEEFLTALSEERLCEEITDAFGKNEALPFALHEKALDLYRQYLIVGGMPRAVLEYIETGRFLTVPDVQRKIINDYIADMAKYATKFQYKLAQKGGTATIFGSAVDWLQFAGIVLKCARIEHGYMPVAVYNDLSRHGRRRIAHYAERRIPTDYSVRRRHRKHFSWSNRRELCGAGFC
jgi:hypothetical protein